MWYCLGSGGGVTGSAPSPASAPKAEMVEKPDDGGGGAATAREPVPAQGTTAQNRHDAAPEGLGEADSDDCSNGSMGMGGPF